MAEQHSSRGNTITASPYEQAFETPIWPYGIGGLNLTDALDLIPVGEYSRLTNLTHEKDRELTARPGQWPWLTANPGGAHHSIRRLNDPIVGSYAYVVGTGADLYMGTSGALALKDTGYRATR